MAGFHSSSTTYSLTPFNTFQAGGSSLVLNRRHTAQLLRSVMTLKLNGVRDSMSLTTIGQFHSFSQVKIHQTL